MAFVETTSRLTHAGVMVMFAAAIARAEAISQPQCIVIVDASGELLGEIRMTGAKFLGRKSALAKALTAASVGAPTVGIAEAVRPLSPPPPGQRDRPARRPADSQGRRALRRDRRRLGSGAQDVAVAEAALDAVSSDRA